jgi:hypothetical protein
MKWLTGALAALAFNLWVFPAGAQVVYSSSGSTIGDILTTVNAFRTDLGALNPNVAGSFDSGRREINWDGVPDSFAAPNALPADFFNVNSPRGVVMSTPGTGFEVSADSSNPTSTPTQFGNIDPAYPGFFDPFSPERLFTALGSNVVDVNFFIPGSSTPAFVTGFGAVFSDVDLASTTTMTFFGSGGVLLGTWEVPFFSGNETFSFLGVLFDDPIISSVRIMNGNQVLAPGQTMTDLVVMDDFIFGEPTLQAAVPEPGTWAMLLIGFAAIGLCFRRRRLVLSALPARRKPTEIMFRRAA